MTRRLVAAIACRNNGSRLYGKPLQNLDVKQNVRILDNLVNCIRTIPAVDEIVLGIAEGSHNEIFKDVAAELGLRYIVGDGIDVLSRLIKCGRLAGATDIFRATSESPFLYFEAAEGMWRRHQQESADATFLDDIVDGCGFQIISLRALEEAHAKGNETHRSELCSLYIRQNATDFRIITEYPPERLRRPELRLTVDTPEDLVLCRAVYERFAEFAPRIPVLEVLPFIESLSAAPAH
ncbi:MAG: acylneuraminate cytidylyltransferase [Gemmatimonadaceae bacterium]|nr:acylneuraminate cytidylyltransferase [Gemmatimonadaceae bacterium]